MDLVSRELRHVWRGDADRHDEQHGGSDHHGELRARAECARLRYCAAQGEEQRSGSDHADSGECPADRRGLGEAVDRRHRSGPTRCRAEQRDEPGDPGQRQIPSTTSRRQRVHGQDYSKPRRQRGVLDRIPGPIAAPPLLGIRPPGTEADGDGDDRQRGEQLTPDLLEVDTPGHRSGERWQRGGQAEVQQRRMDRHRRMLEDGRHPHAGGARDGETIEGGCGRQIGDDQRRGDGGTHEPGSEIVPRAPPAHHADHGGEAEE